ncbi:VOC family protein [Pedococcus bigeumensis]|uniref:VOC family protein n=1 Tax=Pedococcus bigeumensis TaxID=433644 RepID=A0A502CSY6_9MICO|nr:VOC family protein [Pedococcus bigeumensis]TPG14916.1 VOC family protein [Pedococcus bigeumensis]
MITALHTLVYAQDPAAARDFFRDVLRFPATDTGGGWLIFRTGPSELGVHPSSWDHGGEGGTQVGGTDQRFDLSLLCDDLATTMAELEERGAEFEGGVTEQSWGTTVQLVVPGAGTMTLYQPRYEPPALGRSELEAMW